MNKIPVWIDTDTGVDDALALIMAVSLPELEPVGVSAVAGNTTVANAFRNARDVLSLVKREDVPVYKGSERPLVKMLKTAEAVHGLNGLGDVILPASKAKVETLKAIDALYEAAKRYSGSLVICAIGPLTNIAAAIIVHPDIVDHIKEIDVMGGALDGGNITPCAEYNMFTDPHSAECVFRSGVRVNMFGLDVTLKAFLDRPALKEIASHDSSVSRLFISSNGLLMAAQEKAGEAGLCEHDACPIVYAAHPDWFEGKECGIYVECDGKITQGKTVCDLWTDYKFPDRHCKAFTGLDLEKFKGLIIDMFRRYEEEER